MNCRDRVFPSSERRGFAHKVAGVADSPPREEGWSATRKKVPFRNGADGVVAHTSSFETHS